jgi:hypothetical protein
MIDRSLLSQLAELQEPAHIEQIVLAQQAIGCVFPQEYVDLLKTANGLQMLNVVSLILYSTDEIEERNLTYEVKDYLPGWVLIGDDGGGRGVLLDCDEPPGAIYLVGLGSMLRSDASMLAPTIIEWVTRHFSLEPYITNNEEE